MTSDPGDYGTNIDGCEVGMTHLPHQLEDWRRFRDMRGFCYFYDVGLGKTKMTFDDAAWWRKRGEVNGMLILAPNGVHRNWITVEMPKMFVGGKGMYWRTGSSKTKWQMKMFDDLLRSRFPVLAVSYDALDTEDGAAIVKRFLADRQVFTVADEAHHIKNPAAKRTKRAMKVSASSVVRRSLTGTAVTERPFDAYSVVLFSDPDFWSRETGINSYQGFKTQFGVWEKKFRRVAVSARFPRGLQEYPQLSNYRNLGYLRDVLEKVSITRDADDTLDLPEKTYERMEFDLSEEQRRVYDSLVTDSLAVLDDGEVVATPLVITQLMRLHQVSCGYVGVSTDGENTEVLSICKNNPRLDLLGDVAQDVPHKCIIFCRFRADVPLIQGRLTKLGLTHEAYHGGASAEENASAIERFNDGDSQFLVSTISKGAEGLTLLGNQDDPKKSVNTVIYYSKDHRLTKRIQSEGRCRRIGQRRPVRYIDIVAVDTVDDQITESLVGKKEVEALITGKTLRSWLTRHST